MTQASLPPKTTPLQKLGIFAVCVWASLLCAEVGMRMSGLILGFPQEAHNAFSVMRSSNYRILTLGESTTAGNKSWPYFLERQLNAASPDRSFSVFNGAVAGTSTPFILTRLEEQLDRYRPHLVIAMMGHNDGEGFFWEPGAGDTAPPWFARLRLFKLTRWLAASWANRTRLSPEPSNDLDFTQARRACFIAGDPDAANKAYELLFRANRTGAAAREWARCLLSHDRFEAAETKYALSVQMAPEDRETRLEVGIFYCGRKDLLRGEEHLRKAISLDPGYVLSYQRLADCYYANGAAEEKIERFLRRNLLYLRVDRKARTSEITAFHYRKLQAILKRRRIPLIAMQYPTRKVEELKAYFDGDADVVFLGNEVNFSQALKGGKYEDFFLDRIGTTFGHATDAGNLLIAENASGSVLEIIAEKEGGAR